MLKETIEKALNEQVNAELYSAYLYLTMESYYHEKGLEGFARWFKSQSREELYHAMKMYDYIVERGGTPRLMEIKAPPADWDSPLDVARAQLKHEQYVTSLINNLMDLAVKERDHATANFLQWYIDEQVEEEASAEEMVRNLEMVGDNGHGLLMLDREAAQRALIFTFPHEVNKE